MKKLLSITVATLALVAYSPTAFSAFEGLSMMRIGDWEVDFSGNVNAFYTFVDCDGAGVGNPIYGGLACGSADGRDFVVNAVRTGLLPSWLNFYAATETDSGWQTAVHLSFQPGVDGGNQAANGGIDGALGLNTSNFRQVFLTFGNDEFGTFKIGRDLGVFGSDAINNDMTLLGVGTVGGTTGGGNTSLGRIGAGYIYADWKAQVQYKISKVKLLGGTASATLAIIDPWAVSASPEIRNEIEKIAPIPPQERDRRGFESKVNYDVERGDFKFSLRLGAIYQSLRSADPEASNVFFDFLARSAFGVDYGGIVKSGPFSLVGYRYTGNGIGTTGFFQNGVGLSFDGTKLTLAKRHSDGFYVQSTFVLPDTGTKLGLSYGQSNLDLTSGEYDIRNNPGALVSALEPTIGSEVALTVSRNLSTTLGNLVKTNESWIAGIYHPVGEALNLVAEYTSTTAEAHNGHKAEEDVFALGAIMFF